MQSPPWIEPSTGHPEQRACWKPPQEPAVRARPEVYVRVVRQELPQKLEPMEKMVPYQQPARDDEQEDETVESQEDQSEEQGFQHCWTAAFFLFHFLFFYLINGA